MKIVEVELGDGVVAKGLVDSQLAGKVSPIVIDFLGAKLSHRLRRGADAEAIVKAIGLKKSLRRGKYIYDFTAGLGTEAFLLAKAGFSVIAFERDPLVFELLEDGLERLRAHDSEINLEFVFGDAVEIVGEGMSSGTFPPAYAVTLDPMFEDDSTQSKSQPKKEMATLRRHLDASSTEEIERMMEVAMRAATDRVVVKRPNGSRELTDGRLNGRAIRPIHQIEGKSARFDIYSRR